MELGDVLSDALCNATAVAHNDLAFRHNVETLNSVNEEVLCNVGDKRKQRQRGLGKYDGPPG